MPAFLLDTMDDLPSGAIRIIAVVFAITLCIVLGKVMMLTTEARPGRHAHHLRIGEARGHGLWVSAGWVVVGELGDYVDDDPNLASTQLGT